MPFPAEMERRPVRKAVVPALQWSFELKLEATDARWTRCETLRVLMLQLTQNKDSHSQGSRRREQKELALVA